MRGCVIIFILSAVFALVGSEGIKLAFHPKPEGESTLIWNTNSTYKNLSDQLDNFLKVYRKPSLTEGRVGNLVDCSYNSPPQGDSVCKIPTEIMKPCIPSEFFGYKSLEPCVIIEFKKKLHWKPAFFNSSKSFPDILPEQLKNKIKSSFGNETKDTIWLSCEGERAPDVENILDVSYFPIQGFPGYFFPYTGQKGYLNPIVAVKFKLSLGVVVHIACMAWAPGILHNFDKEVGVTRFTLLVEK